MTQSVTTTSPHPSIRVRTNGPVTEISVRTPLARWYRACLWSILPTVAIVVPAVCVLSDHLPQPLRGIAIIVVVSFVLFLLLLVLLAFGNIVTSANLLIDGQTLQIRPSAARFSIPLQDIRGISLSTHPRRRLDIDPSAPPYRLFTLRRPVSLDVDTPAGRIRFLRGRTPSDLPPLFAALIPLLPPVSPDVPPPPVVANSDTRTRFETVGLRLLTAVVLAIAAGFSYWEFIPAFQSRSWPSTPGHVDRSHWEHEDGPSGGRYKFDVSYTYAVNHNTYTGDRIAFGHDNPANAIRDILLAHPAGSTAAVYYSRRDPRQSTLIPGPGPLDWFGVAMGSFMLLVLLPIVPVRSASPDVRALAARYRVKPGKKSEPLTIESAVAATNELYRWTTPPDFFERERRERRRTYLRSAVRTLLIVLAIEYAFYAYLLPHIPLLFERSRLVWIFLGFNLYAVVPFTFIAFVRTKPAEFRLTPHGIHISTREKPLLRYDSIQSFTLSRASVPPHDTTLDLHIKDGNTRAIPLPRDLADQIIATISQHLPQQPPPPRYSPLTGRDWALGFAVTAAYTVAVGLLLRHVTRYIPHDWAGIILLATFFFLGPGTVATLLLHRRRATVQLFSLAVVLNLFGGLTTVLYAALPKIISVLK